MERQKKNAPAAAPPGVRRRDVITSLAGAAIGCPTVARAQSAERTRRLGVLMNLADGDPEGQARWGAVRQGLQELRWREGGNLRVDMRWWGTGESDRLRAHAGELIRAAPDALFASGGRALEALQQATHSIPIVFVVQSNPVGPGIQSLARPGGNASGFSQYEASLLGKLLETFRETVPGISRVLIMYHPENPGWTNPDGYLRGIEEVVRGAQVVPAVARVKDSAEIERAIVEFARTPNGSLLLPTDALTLSHREQIVRLAAEHRLPGAYSYPAFPRNGGLMSYGIDHNDLYRRSASYIDRVLKGESPGELPVQAPTKFEFVINMKTAKALGLDLGPMLLARVDEVVE
jgi:putative tryptophan/tyrosine transport system substrate-binding protein